MYTTHRTLMKSRVICYVLKLPPFSVYFPQNFILLDDEKMDSIRRAVESYDRFTCIRYVPATGNDEDGDYVHFIINKTM